MANPISELKTKKVLPMWEYHKFVAIKVDEEGSCKDQHILVSGPWHRYRDDQGQMFAVRCPHMLSHDERSRVIDEENWEAVMESKKAERLRLEAAKRIEEKSEARRFKSYGG